MLNVRVTPDCEAWLEAFAKGRGLTKSDVAREAIAQFQRTHLGSRDGDLGNDCPIDPEHLARLSGVLDREGLQVDDLVWGDATRSFKRLCFPSNFRRLQREKVRPAFKSFASGFDSLPRRGGWRIRVGDPCPPPRTVTSLMLGEVEYYSSLPMTPSEPVETIHFSWSGNALSHERPTDPQFSLRADAAHQQFVPMITRVDGTSIRGQALDADELTGYRVHGLLVDAFDVIATELTGMLRGDPRG